MALTAADKRWIRTAFRAELAELLADMAVASTGSYDGATNVPDDDAPESKKDARRIGFSPPSVGTRKS